MGKMHLNIHLQICELGNLIHVQNALWAKLLSTCKLRHLPCLPRQYTVSYQRRGQRSRALGPSLQYKLQSGNNGYLTYLNPTYLQISLLCFSLPSLCPCLGVVGEVLSPALGMVWTLKQKHLLLSYLRSWHSFKCSSFSSLASFWRNKNRWGWRWGR